MWQALQNECQYIPQIFRVPSPATFNAHYVSQNMSTEKNILLFFFFKAWKFKTGTVTAMLTRPPVPHPLSNIKCVKLHTKQETISLLKPTVKWCTNSLTFRRRTFFQILAHPVFKMWVIQKPNKVAVWKKTAFWRGKNGDYTACLKYSVRIFVE